MKKIFVILLALCITLIPIATMADTKLLEQSPNVVSAGIIDKAEKAVINAKTEGEYKIAVQMYNLLLDPHTITSDKDPNGKFNGGRSVYKQVRDDVWVRIGYK